MGEEERLLVEVLNGLNNGAIQTAAKSLLRATFISDERLQHGAHHVELQNRKDQKLLRNKLYFTGNTTSNTQAIQHTTNIKNIIYVAKTI